MRTNPEKHFPNNQSINHMKLITGILAALLTLNNATWAEDSATIKSFVKRSNGKLVVDGKTFRFSGANLDWLVLANDEFARLGNNTGTAKNSYRPSRWMIDDAFATLVKMNGTVARVWSVGCQGTPLSIEPELGKFNEEALQQVDYILDSAKRHGIRLVMTLCDNWDFYTGGRYQFLKWRGITDHSKFWVDPGCKADYKAYVAVLVNRTNSLTGVAYKNDPTILCWESANEFVSPPEWEREMAVYIKSLDPHHLFMVGNSDVADSRHADVQKRWIAIPEFDILQRHYYRVHGLPWAAAKDAEAVAAAGKVFIIGEYGWDGQNATIEELKGWLKEVETNTTVSGDLLWALRGRKDKDNFMAVPGAGGDWWALYYPGRTTGSLNTEEDMKVRVRMLSDHAAAMKKIR